MSVKDVDAFKRDHELVPSDQVETPPPDDAYGPPMEEEPDLRAEDDALVAAALDAEPDEPEDDDSDPEAPANENGDDAAKARRRRGRRGGRGRRSGGRGGKKALEGTFDHGSEGYGLWLDPAVQDDPVYAEHWAGHRPVVVSIEQDQIVIRRAGEQDGDGGAEAEGDAESSGSGDTSESAALDPDEFDT